MTRLEVVLHHFLRRSRRFKSSLRWTVVSVLANMGLTLLLWVGIYEMRTDSRLHSDFFFDSTIGRSTGYEFLDGVLNGMGTMLLLGAVSFAMLAFALHDFRRLVQAWLHLSCLLILFLVSGFAFFDAMEKFFPHFDPSIRVAVAAAAAVSYGSVGAFAFFCDLAPLLLHQLYVVTNCSLISVFYLRAFPNQTAWFVLWSVVLWVLAPIGPLKKIQEKAGDYSNHVLRFVMFTAGETKTTAATRHRRTVAGGETENDTDSDTEVAERRTFAVRSLIDRFNGSPHNDRQIKDKIRERRRFTKPESSSSSTTTPSASASNVGDDVDLGSTQPSESAGTGTDTEPEVKEGTTASALNCNEDDTAVVDMDICETDSHESDDELLGQLISYESGDELAARARLIEGTNVEESADDESSESAEEETELTTAADALNDTDSIRLGMGDFVFYSVLIGKAATSGSVVATIMAAVGVISGLGLTLTVFSNSEHTTPALPLSIILGTILHFQALFVEHFVDEHIFDIHGEL